MESKSENTNDTSQDAMPSAEEFGNWLAADAANYDHFLQIVQRSLEAGRGDPPPKSPDKAKAVMETDRASRVMQVVIQKSKALMEVMQRPPGATSAKDRLVQGKALMDEVNRAMLELPEWNRTRFLEGMVIIRDRLRAVWDESDQ